MSGHTKLLGDGSATPAAEGAAIARVVHPAEVIPADAILTKRIRPLTTCGACPRLVTTYVPPVEIQRGCRDSGDAPSDIVFVLTQPDVDRDRHGAPMSLPGIPGETRSVFQRALRVLISEDSERAKSSVVGIFAAACTPVVPREKPRAAVLHQCHPHIKNELDALEPSLIVAFGAESLKQLGITRKHADVRGRILESHETGLPPGTGVIVTFSDAAVAAAPGLYRTFEQDLRNGFKWLASGGADIGEDLEEYNAAQRAEIDEKFKRITKGHKFACTVEEVVALCDEIINYVEVLPDGKIGPGTIAVDTETTSLHADKDGARLIAFCFSWGEGLSTAFRFDHPFAPQEYLDRLPELFAAVARVLACPKPKTFHNAKFDLKWIELAYKMPVANVVWCSMCGEHLIDEDKKGHYGLKSLTTTWLPDLSGYEDRLDEHVPQRADQNEVEWARTMAEHPLAQERPGLAEALREHANRLELFQKAKDRFAEAKAVYHQAMVAWRLRKKHHVELKAADAAARAAWPRPVKPKAPGLLSTDADRAAYPELLRAYSDALAGYERVRAVAVPKFNEKAPTAPSLASMGADRRPEPPDLPADLEGAVKASQDAGYEFIPPDVLCQYGAIDADVTRRLTRLQVGALIRETNAYRKKNPQLFPKGPYSLMASHAIPASRVLGRMEFVGMKVDLEYADKLQKALTELIDAARADAMKCAAGYLGPNGEPFNPASGAHLADVLYLRGWTHPDGSYIDPVPCLEYTELTNKMSTTAKALKPYLKEEEVHDDANPGKLKKVPTHDSFFVSRIALLKKATKARDTSLMNIRAFSARDGRIHTSFHIPGTGTGRTSCFAPWTRVLTARGYVEIQHVKVGDEVLTHKGRWRTVRAVLDQGERTVEDFTLSTGVVLTATPDHRMYASDGAWVAIGDLANEHLEALDARTGKPRRGRHGIPRYLTLADDRSNREGARDDVPHRAGCLEGGHPDGGTEDALRAQVCGLEGRREESDDRQNRGSVPPLDRGLRRRVRIPDADAQRGAPVRASHRDGEGTRTRGVARDSRGASHRREPEEQLVGQSGARDARRTQPDSRRSREVAVVARGYSRQCRVFDLTVEDDHSFVVEGVNAHNSSSPNQQNVPSKLAGWSLKKLFVADSDEFVVVNWDWKGAEVRVFTVYASDPALIKALNDGLDMHSFFASRVYKKPYEDYQNRASKELIPDDAYRAVLDRERQQIKRVVFGILYGAGPVTIAEQCGCSLDEAKEVIALLFSMFPSIKEYLDNTRLEVERYQAVETVFGRRRRFPLAGSSRHAARAVRQAGNFRIQSTSSDIVIGQLCEIMEMTLSDRTWPEWGIHEPLHKLGVKIFLTVHDSIVFQWPKKHLHALLPWITYYGETRVKEKYPWLPVPFAGDVEVGDSYGEVMAIPKYLAKLPVDFFEVERREEDFDVETVLREDAFVE